MGFDERWAEIAAFIQANTVDTDATVIDSLRKWVKYGGNPAIAGPGLGIPGQAASLVIPLVAGPGLGIPYSPVGVIVFVSAEALQEARTMIADLASDVTNHEV